MAIRIVPDDPISEPEDLANPEIASQILLDGGLVEFRVAVRVEEAGLGRQQRPAALDIDRSPLEDDSWLEERFAHLLGDAGGNDIVGVVGWILVSPGIVAPVVDRAFPLARPVANDVIGAVIPAPGIVGRVVMEENAARIDASLREQETDTAGELLVSDIDPDQLRGGEVLDHLGKDARNRLKGSWPTGLFVGPGEPSRLVRFPLGRHVVSKGTRGCGRNSLFHEFTLLPDRGGSGHRRHRRADPGEMASESAA